MDRCDLLCLDLGTAERLRAKLDPGDTAAAAGRFKLLGDPTRLMIAMALHEQELCGCDLAWICGQSEKLVSHHLGRLRAAGLATARRDGKVVFSSLTADGHAVLGSLVGAAS